MKLVGENIKKFRLQSNLTQEALANISGIDWSTISRLERGVVNTSISVVFALSEAMGITPAQLME